jgi:hypothetical protein
MEEKLKIRKSEERGKCGNIRRKREKEEKRK